MTSCISGIRPLVCAACAVALLPAACKSDGGAQDKAAEAEEVAEDATKKAQAAEGGDDETSMPTATPAPASQPAQTRGDAPELAVKVWEAAGGRAYDDVEMVAFDFVVEQEEQRVFVASHEWNKAEMIDHIQWTSQKGEAWDVTISLEGKDVEVGTLNGEPIPADRRAEAADQAYARWVNDSYWLLKPVKVLDPGVTAADEGTEEWMGADAKVLKLTFGDVGLTSGDQYWLYVDPDTHHVRGWKMLLQGQQGDPAPVVWGEYQQVGPLNLSLSHEIPGAKRRILLDNVTVK